jgi:hypothetical protein
MRETVAGISAIATADTDERPAVENVKNNGSELIACHSAAMAATRAARWEIAARRVIIRCSNAAAPWA